MAWPLGYKEQDVGLIVRAISFPDFQPGGLRETIFLLQDCVAAVQGQPRTLILVPIESTYATSY